MARAARLALGVLLLAGLVAGGLFWNARRRETQRAGGPSVSAASPTPRETPRAPVPSIPAAEPLATEPVASPVPPSPSPSPSPLPEATDAELRGLRAPRVADRRRAVELMFERRPSDEMAAEVARAVRTTIDTGIKRRLECLRVWAGDPDELAAGIERLPRDEAGYRAALDPIPRCILEVVARRAAAAPEAAADALAVAALFGREGEQEIARDGLARTSLPGRPRAIEEALESEDAEERAHAYEVVLALGALERDPAAVEACLADPEVAEVCVDEALSSPAGPRLLAGAIAGEEDDGHLWSLAGSRGLDDRLWPAMVEVARDRERPAEERRRALALIAERGDPGLAADVAPLLSDPEDPMSADARRTVAALQRRRIAEGN